jgi:ATP-binding cassette subfamily F protein 3
LGCFLFSADDVFKKIGVLSGGERNRYALLKMLLYPANFLLLDEPTNHLDLRAKDVLLEALSEYNGTVVFVSHDRYFIDKLATRVFEVGEGRVETYPGNYEDYIWRKEGSGAQSRGEGDSRGGGSPTSSDGSETRPHTHSETRPHTQDEAGLTELAIPQLQPGNGSEPALAAPETKPKRLNPIRRKQMEERCQDLEEEVARVEAAIAHCEAALQNFVSAEETQRLTQELRTHRTQLDALMGEWEELAQALQEQQEQ